ncbi:MAG TPA: flagellar filament capping protein FliD [Candidatus Krumholzibacteria bacterium]|nr:flagellar filament capping protein FliD [Candidatus Krumholzibacteria bacterium]
MSAIQFGGLATGMDTSSIVSQLLEIKKQPIYRLEERKKGFQAQISALGTFKSKLAALQEAAKKLDTANEFSALKASSSNEDVLQVSAGSTAAPGSYKIQVTSRAVAQKDMSQAFDSRLDSVGSGRVSFTVNGETTNLDLVGYNSIESLVNQINDNVEGVGASLLYDGNATGGYRIVLSGTEAGTAGGFTADFSGLTGGVTPTFTNSTAADDAHITIDGIAVTATGNSIEDAISGLTLDLRDAAPGEDIYVDVARDNEGIAELVKGMVDAYNDVFGFITDQSKADGSLRDNPTLRTVASQVENMFSSTLQGGLGSIGTFSLIGITRGEGRQLEFDEDKFSEKLSASFGAVRDLFIDREGNEGKMGLVDGLIDTLTDSSEGIFKTSIDLLNDKVDNADDTIARYERSAESYKTTLERKFTAMEMMVSQLQAQGNYLSSMVFR